MTTSFPASFDNFTNPTPSSNMSDAGVLHSDQHANANDAIRALEAVVGVTNSTVSTSHTKKLADIETALTTKQTTLIAGTNITITGNTISSTGGSGASALTVLDEGVSLNTGVTSINFAGAVVTASAIGNAITVDVSGSSGGAGGVTNLTTTPSATTITINSDTGTDAIIPSVTTTVAGVMTATDKTKLDGIATGATVNSTDATLLSRSNHTGLQTIGTVTGLQLALDGKATSAQGTLADTAVQPAGLTKAAVGLANVDNTSDLAKPISTLTQTALNTKTATGHLHVFADISGLVSGLAAKADVGHEHVSANITDLSQSLSEKDLYIQTLSMANVTAIDGTEKVAVIQGTSSKLTTVDGILARSNVMVATKDVGGNWTGMAAPGGGAINDMIVISSAEPSNTDGRPDGTIYIKVA